jgi:hypothetical protein
MFYLTSISPLKPTLRSKTLTHILKSFFIQALGGYTKILIPITHSPLMIFGITLRMEYKPRNAPSPTISLTSPYEGVMMTMIALATPLIA